MTLKGYRPLQARLTAIGETRDLVRQMGLETVRGAKLKVARKTGTTGRTIRLTRVTDDTVTVEVGGAGAILELGSKPHLIRPKNGRALRWPAQGTPRTLAGRATSGAVRKLGRAAFAFATLVHHPGTKKQPFLVPAAREAVKKLGITKIIERWNSAA